MDDPNAPADLNAFQAAADLLARYGVTRCLAACYVEKAVIRDRTARADAVKVLREMLRGSVPGPITELVVSDGYLLPRKAPPDYLDLLCGLLGYWARLRELTVVVRPDHDRGLAAELARRVAAFPFPPPPRLTVKMADVFHDRFWIANRAGGMVVGTSLNGLGRRYALVEYLAADDLADICARLDELP